MGLRGVLAYVAADFPVKPGWYRVRICYGGKDTLSADELDGDDHYEVSLWPEPPSDITELKNSNL